MNRQFLLLIVLIVLTYSSQAQTRLIIRQDTTRIRMANDGSEKFKKNDSAYRALETKKKAAEQFSSDSLDLALNKCDFEKEANAEILFDDANLIFTGFGMRMEHFRKIKIYNDLGKNAANIRIEFNNRFGAEKILAVTATTLNWVNGKVERTKLDSSLIYNVHTDKQKDAVVFTMPNVKPGSVIEYAYVWQRGASQNLPDWDFQNDLPTRISIFTLGMTPQFQFSLLTNISKPFEKDTVVYNGYGHLWAMTDVPSAKDEPFMRSKNDGRDRLSIILKGITDPFTRQHKDVSDSWETVASQIANDKEFYKPLDQSLSDVDTIISKAKTLKTDDEKIRYVFNIVKNRMRWNEDKVWGSKDGIKLAWKKQTGNWGEINMILCNLLNKAGVKAYPMMASTRENGIVYGNFASIYQINTLVTYVPIDTANYYILDAASKYNQYNSIPFYLLNSTGVWMDKQNGHYGAVYIHNHKPARQWVSVDAAIKPDGSVEGSAVITSYGFNKAVYRELHATLDEKKYNDILTDNDHSIQITSLKLENAEVDSLPLTQNIAFKDDLYGTDDKYMYLNPNLFALLHNNPFVSLKRQTNIDFGSSQLITITGRYKLPGGYKIESLPHDQNIAMADSSIIFKREVQAENGTVSVSYLINYKRSAYSSSEYSNFYAYFKKMFELLNEPVVLKKS